MTEVSRKEPSPIHQAIEKTIGLFGWKEKVSVYSYKNDYDTLWGISDEPIVNSKKIWCVLDDSDTPRSWLPLAVWGRYYRAKYGSDATKLILIGKESTLKPPNDTQGILYVPELYRNDCTEYVYLDKENDIVNSVFQNLFDAITLFLKPEDIKSEAEQEYGLKNATEKDEGWRRMVFATLAAPGIRHKASNEIAPMILKDALKMKREPEKDGEREALLKLWKWALKAFNEDSGDNNENSDIDINEYRFKDIWDLWSRTEKAKYLLIDDQEEYYKKILERALEEMGVNVDETTLGAWNSVPKKYDGEINVDKVIDTYKCLFLDIRLTDDEHKKRNFKEYDSVKLTKAISEKDPFFPIIIFSSSQQREIDQIFSEYKNIITCFRKPGIAGSVDSIDGTLALKNLFTAIKKALEMIENHMVIDKLKMSVCGRKKILIKYNSKYIDRRNIEHIENDERVETNVNESFKKKLNCLMALVFLHKQYEKAFAFPYSFFEELFKRAEKTNHLKNIIANIKIEVSDALASYDIEFDHADYSKIIRSSVHIDKLILSYFTIDQFSNDISRNLNLNLRALSKFRHLAAHDTRDFTQMRRESIAILSLFLDVLFNNFSEHNALLDRDSIDELGNILILLTGNDRILHTLSKTVFGMEYSEYKYYIYELFAATCYYGENELYDPINTLCKYYEYEKKKKDIENFVPKKNINLRVNNLDLKVTEGELKNKFEEYGNVKSVNIPRAGIGLSQGYGFVDMADKKRGLVAIFALNDTPAFGGNIIRINKVLPRPPRR